MQRPLQHSAVVTAKALDEVCLTGIAGLDEILRGGLPRNCTYLVEGVPGVGKTTLAMQFLLEGRASGERGLYVTLSETRRELDIVALSHGWDLKGIDVLELSTITDALEKKPRTTLFQASEFELDELTRLLMETTARVKPNRVVLDSLSELRLLTQSPLRFRREMLALKQKLIDAGCTVLLLDDRTGNPDTSVHSVVHGVVQLIAAPLSYGVFRRYLNVAKLRGVRFREGNHDYVIRRGGLEVFARLVAAEHLAPVQRKIASSSDPRLDTLVGGGLHYGTSNLLMGPAGSGKSTVAMIYAHAAAMRGDRVRYCVFDETVSTLTTRARELGIDFTPLVQDGRIAIDQIDPAEVAPGELAARIREDVEKRSMRVVVLDSLNGYINAMPHEEYLHLHLHELVTYLNQQGVLSLMILAQHGLMGPMGVPVDVSYLADTVMLFRFFEAMGEVKKAVSVIKKRSGAHETTLRELRMTSKGVLIGDPLSNFQGVLTGVPELVGGSAAAIGGR
jgi:circadian clock protein KaiC